jgi:sugar phosphate isomerase/epimerase
MIASFGISNIAWPPEALEHALDEARALGFSAIEIAPFNVFGRWHDIAEDTLRLREKIEGRGMACHALQGIVFNVPGVELFASEASRGRLERHLGEVADLAGILGARACVYGAPKQRDPGDLTPEQARMIAVAFFRRIGPAFVERGAAITFEPNARSYGCRFGSTTAEAVDFVEAVGTKGVGLQIDTGTVFLEQEDPGVLGAAAALAPHAHVSEPGLEPIGATGVDHGPLAAAMKKADYTGSLSIEMRAVGDWRGAMRRAADLVRAAYL